MWFVRRNMLNYNTNNIGERPTATLYDNHQTIMLHDVVNDAN